MKKQLSKCFSPCPFRDCLFGWQCCRNVKLSRLSNKSLLDLTHIRNVRGPLINTVFFPFVSKWSPYIPTRIILSH